MTALRPYLLVSALLFGPSGALGQVPIPPVAELPALLNALQALGVPGGSAQPFVAPFVENLGWGVQYASRWGARWLGEGYGSLALDREIAARIGVEAARANATYSHAILQQMTRVCHGLRPDHMLQQFAHSPHYRTAVERGLANGQIAVEEVRVMITSAREMVAQSARALVRQAPRAMATTPQGTGCLTVLGQFLGLAIVSGFTAYELYQLQDAYRGEVRMRRYAQDQERYNMAVNAMMGQFRQRRWALPPGYKLKDALAMLNANLRAGRNPFAGFEMFGAPSGSTGGGGGGAWCVWYAANMSLKRIIVGSCEKYSKPESTHTYPGGGIRHNPMQKVLMVQGAGSRADAVRQACSQFSRTGPVSPNSTFVNVSWLGTRQGQMHDIDELGGCRSR